VLPMIPAGGTARDIIVEQMEDGKGALKGDIPG